MSALTQPLLTPQKSLAWECLQEIRHEYVPAALAECRAEHYLRKNYRQQQLSEQQTPDEIQSPASRACAQSFHEQVAD